MVMWDINKGRVMNDCSLAEEKIEKKASQGEFKAA